MQIGAVGTSALSPRDSLETGASAVFRESLGLIHTSLVEHYRLADPEARRLEKDLFVWFERFCRRPGSPPARECRHSLLVMACLFARGQQKFLVETGDRPFDEKLDRVLRRDPAEVAREVSRPLKLLYYRLHAR